MPQDQLKTLFRNYGLKESTCETYIDGLTTFQRQTGINLLKERSLKKIENATQRFIRQNENKLSPKYLNTIYCAVRRLCQIRGLIKSTHMFRQIKFERQARKNDALFEQPITTEMMRKVFETFPIEDKIDVGFYGLCGLRPRLIPQLRVKNIYPPHYKIENGKIKLKKPTIIIIPRTFEGNKGNVTFFTILPVKIAELLETWLNTQASKVTPETKLSETDNRRDVYTKMKRILRKVGYTGRPYMLRKYADDLLDRITYFEHDEDFKEFLMGHKGEISAVYQKKGLSPEKEKEYLDKYMRTVNEWIDEKIFGKPSKQEIDKAEMLASFARNLGVPDEKINAIFDLLKTGQMTPEQFEQELNITVQKQLEKQMENKFEQMFVKLNKKYNGGEIKNE